MAKYIKREWKNGKWVYTYSTSNSNPVTSVTRTQKPVSRPGKWSSFSRLFYNKPGGGYKDFNPLKPVNSETAKKKNGFTKQRNKKRTAESVLAKARNTKISKLKK